MEIVEFAGIKKAIALKIRDGLFYILPICILRKYRTDNDFELRITGPPVTMTKFL